MVTTLFAGLSVFQIVPIEAEESSFTASVKEDAGKLNVTASAPSDVLPEDAKLIVTPIKNDGNDSLYEDILNKLNEEAQKENRTIDAFIAYDIQFEKDKKETEPSNGSVNVNLKWDTPVKPEGVQDSDQISVIHLKDDSSLEDLTKEKDDTKNHATTETDEKDPLSLKATAIQSDSFSIYTVVWSRDNISKINVHYTDENGKEISPAESVDIPQDAGIESFAKAIDGYTFSSATINHTNVTELKTENGYLYFNDGTNWNQASSADVSLTYSANPVPEETPESSVAPATSDPQKTTAEPEKKTEPSEKETILKADTKDNRYSVTVTYGKDAGLPEGTTLSVKTLSEDHEEYKNARNAVAASEKTDADTLGMTALDITLKDKDGNRIEPEDDSRVKVEIKAADLPDTVSSIDIHHITESSNAVSGFFRKVYTGTSDKAETVKKNVTVTDGKAVTDFEVSGFSVFTITWTTNNSTGTKSNIGNVTMHYVNEDGLEIDRTAPLTEGSLSKIDGEIVKISDWVNDENNVRKVSGYKYVKATVGSVNGTEITAVKVKSTSESGKTVYKLYYTNATNPDSTDAQWTEYRDSVSGNNGNNADIYLVFYSTSESVNVHFVDEDGNIIINPIYHYANETYEKVTDHTFNIKKTNKTENPWYEPIQNYEFTGRVHMGETGWQGFAFSRIKATVDDSGNYRYQYSLADTGDNWTDLTATDVYLIYKKTDAAIKTPIEIKYINSNGDPMVDEAGNSLDRVVDASEWTSGQWQNLQGYSEYVNGYTINDMAIFVTDNGDDAYINKQGNGSGGSTNGLDNVVSKSPTSGTSFSGRPFRYLRYTGSRFQAGNGWQIDDTGNSSGTFKGEKTDKTAPDTKINRYWDINGGFRIYLVYDKNTTGKTYSYTIHYVDEQGNKVAADSQKQTFTDGTYNKTDYTIGVGSKTSDTYYNLATGVNPSGYKEKGYALLGRPTLEQGGLQFNTATFTRDSTSSSWKYQMNGTGEAKELNLTNLDFYVVYKKTEDTTDTGRKVTIHFVDTSGKDITQSGTNKTWATRITLNKNGQNIDSNDPKNREAGAWFGFDFTDQTSFAGSKSYNIPSGYSFVGEYIGPAFNMDANKLVTTTAPKNGGTNSCVQWTYQNNKWYVSHNNSSSADTNKKTDGSDSAVFEGYVTDIYWVYAKTSLTVHYVKLNGDNSISPITGQTSKTLSSLGTKGSPVSLTDSTYAPAIDGLAYIGTRLGPSNVSKDSDLGPDARNVYLDDNGKRIYYFENPNPYPMTKQGNNDMWLYAAPAGRRFTLRKTTSTSDGNTSESYTIEDSQHGTLALNLSEDGTYTATFHGETETTEYTIVKGTDESGNDTYSLTIHNYLTSGLDDVYEIYRDDTNDKAAITIDNDLQYSGYLVSDLNSWLNTRMAASYTGTDKITDYYYSWNKITTGTGYEGEKNTEVVRAQNGQHWNIAYNRKERTSLDVEADNGGRNDTDQKTVAYTVTFHYKSGDGDWQSVTSPRSTIDYYSQLMNGDFETPNKTMDGQKPDAVDKNGKPLGFYTNEFYKKKDGVWQTTASDGLIEIVNTSGKTGADAGASYGWNNSLPFESAHGDQFAELNANRAGALYQDVVTHPNTYLNYWFSHRARGKWPSPGGRYNQDKKAIPEYDTMYLVIMPTKLAMTAADGGELKTQTQLSEFINAHGGFDTDKATAVGQEVTYRNDADGILIEKVSSNDQFWHNVSVPNGYIAKGGLTRFFFVAGPQAYDETGNDENTHGNFIDNVGFNQILPPPQGFHLTVSKTFSGLTTEQIASLVQGKDDESKFKITLSDHHSDPNNKNATDEAATPPNSTLNHAVLSFTVNDSGSAIPFTATAVDSTGANLLTGSNKGDVMLNDDGSVTMTWTFLNQAIDSDKNDQRFNYFAEESNTGVDQYTLNADKQISVKNNDGTTEGENKDQPGSAIIRQGSDATFTLNNTYRSYHESDQPRIVVSKTFYGLTPSGVDEMFADGYEMTVTKQGAEGQSEILSTNDTALDSNVSYTESRDVNHNTTVRWTISGDNWTDGTYRITERNYSSSDYKVTQVKVNGETADIPHDLTADLTKGDISVGIAADNVKLSSDPDDVKSQNAEGDGSLTSVTGIPADTNFVAVQYINITTTNYLVWTATPIGRDVSAAILDKINSSGTDGIGWSPAVKATFLNTVFRSGDAGSIETSYGTVSFDQSAGIVKFGVKAGQQLSWKKFYSTKISGEEQADIRVENQYNPVVRIQKVDSSDTSRTLSGAQFRLFKMNASEKQYYIADGKWNPVGGETFTTGDDGTVSLPGLSAGTYFIEETKAPDGYNRASKPIAFKVKNDSSVGPAKAGELNGIDADTPVPDWNHPFYTIQVENSAGSILPITGGIGTAIFYAAGGILIIGAVILLVRRHKRNA